MNKIEATIYAFFKERRIRLGTSDDAIVACNYVSQGLLDSVGVVDFVLYIESTFDIQFGPEEMSSEELFSIGTTSVLVQRLLSANTNWSDAA